MCKLSQAFTSGLTLKSGLMVMTWRGSVVTNSVWTAGSVNCLGSSAGTATKYVTSCPMTGVLMITAMRVRVELTLDLSAQIVELNM